MPRRITLQKPSSNAKGNTNRPGYIDKNQFLSPYVNELVKQKLENNKKLPKNAYIDVIQKLNNLGIKWLSVTGLKQRVLRAYKIALAEQLSAPAISSSAPPTTNSEDASLLITSPPPPNVNPSDITSNLAPIRKRAGRPKGSTDEFKSHVDKCCTAAKNEITDLYYKEYLKHKQCCEINLGVQLKVKVPKGTFQSIHDRVKKERNLPSSFFFSYNACQKRISSSNLQISDPGKKSPLADIEPHIVTLLLAMADTGAPLSVGQCLPLINSLIHKTPHQLKLIEWKKKHNMHFNASDGSIVSDEELGEVGVSYWNGLVKRNKDTLTTNKGRLFELNRTNWTLYRNFRHMYLDVEKHMVAAGVAVKLDEPKWMDKEGKEVDELNSFGMKVETELTHPHCCLVMDETGGDTNMMNDSASGGKKFVGRKGQEVRQNAGKKGKRYTTIGLTGLDGKPAMCIVIFAGVERNLHMESGIDTTILQGTDNNNDDSTPIDSQQEEDLAYFRSQYGEGKMFPGGPVCDFNNKEVPTMIRYSKSGGITTTILTDILRTVDELGLYEQERRDGIKPFLLLDGHQSRFGIEFLKYITDPTHPWKVCIGVPYGTALWQVGDSSQQNGRYKMRTSEKKKMIMHSRVSQFISELEILPSDIIVIINHAWKNSFADQKGNKAAIASRGWFPLNKNLLLLESLRKTMTEEDREWEERCELFPKMRRQQEVEVALQDPRRPTMRATSNPAAEVLPSTPELNVTQGEGKSILQHIVGHEDLQRIRAENDSKRKQGQTVREGFKRMKKMNAAGSMINLAGTFLIGNDLLQEIEFRQEEKDNIKKAKEEKDLETYHSNLCLLQQLKRDKPDESTWKVDELKIGLRAVKKIGDRANPQNKAGLVTIWNEFRPRVASEIEGLGESEANVSANEAQPLINQTVDVVTGGVTENEGANEEGRTVM